jgi:IPT/TIG domain
MSISSIDTTYASTSTQKVISLTGTNLTANAPITVKIDGALCTNSSLIGNVISCDTPLLSSEGDKTITLTNAYGDVVTLAQIMNYRFPPTPTAIDSTSGSSRGGKLITIQGTSFQSVTPLYELNSVKINNVDCAIQALSPTQVQCITGDNLSAGGPYVISLTRDDGISSVSSAITYQYIDQANLNFNEPLDTFISNYDFGLNSVNRSATLYLKNTGNVSASVSSADLSTGTSSAFLIGTNTCSGATLAYNQSCSIQVVFLGEYVATGSYNTILSVGTSSGTKTLTLQATR